MRNLTATILASAVVALSLFFVGFAAAQAPLRFDSEPLTIETRDGQKHVFTAELALDDGQRQQGLMLRKEMAPDHGMLFDFFEPRDVSMWMHNTLIPLDMLFIGADGIITHIHENAEPQSDTIISSRGPVNFVLELNGGRAKALGITPGDKVISRQIGTAD